MVRVAISLLLLGLLFVPMAHPAMTRVKMRHWFAPQPREINFASRARIMALMAVSNSPSPYCVWGAIIENN